MHDSKYPIKPLKRDHWFAYQSRGVGCCFYFLCLTYLVVIYLFTPCFSPYLRKKSLVSSHNWFIFFSLFQVVYCPFFSCYILVSIVGQKDWNTSVVKINLFYNAFSISRTPLRGKSGVFNSQKVTGLMPLTYFKRSIR